MAIQTYRVTLRADVSADGVDAMDEVVRQCATQLATMVVLINQGRYTPEVRITRTNGVFVETEVPLAAADATFEDGQP